MIIDGIDEVISTLSNFQIENFIKDLESIKISLSKGKLLINCRDFYLSELKEKIEDFEAKYNIFKLLEFNSVQAEKYFEKKFQVPKGEKNPKKDDAVRILKEFVFNQEDKFSPYIFDSIALIVEAKNADIDTDPEFESKLLVKNYKIDFINYRICQREITKKQEGVDINIDAYIKFLCLVAIEGKGIFRKEDFSGYLYKADESLANIDMENAIRDNPFLINENNHFSFRYDFQNIVFKQIAIYSIITLPETFKLNYDFIEVLAQNLRYNSVVTKALYDKFRASEKTVDDFLEDVKKIIERISIYDNDGDNNHLNLLKSEAISNLTVLLINIYNSKNPIEIVARLFSSNVESKSERIELNGVCFVNIPPESGLVFNFEDCIFHNSFIKNFPNFIECGFNSNTHFDKTNKICELNYNNYISKKGSIKKINFDEEIFNTDNSLLKIIKVLEGAGENTKKNLKRYFKTFYINNRIIDFRININSISNKENFLLPVEMITKILLKYGIVADYNGDIIKLNRDFYGRINKYLEGDMPFLELNRAIKEINEEIIKLSA